MANNCSTSYCFYGSREDLEKLIGVFSTNGTYLLDHNAFSLGSAICRVLIATGKATPENACEVYREMEEKGLLPRHPGSINFVSDVGPFLSVDIDSKWTPCNECIDWIIEELNLGAYYYYLAEEFGSDIYESNDTRGEAWGNDFDYCVDALFSETAAKAHPSNFEDGYNFCTEEELVGELCSMLKKPAPAEYSSDDVDELIAEVHAIEWNDNYSFASVHRLDRVSN